MSVDVLNREIYLHNDEDETLDSKTVNVFYKNIRYLDVLDNSPILIHMYSFGGDWAAGMAIYDAIMYCKSKVGIIAYGQAESMSSIVLQAASLRAMMPSCYFMCHMGSLEYSGDHNHVKKAFLFDGHSTDLMLDIYTNKLLNSCKFKSKYKQPTKSKARNFLLRQIKDGDWYLTSREAVEYNFTDFVVGDNNCQNIDHFKCMI